MDMQTRPILAELRVKILQLWPAYERNALQAEEQERVLGPLCCQLVEQFKIQAPGKKGMGVAGWCDANRIDRNRFYYLIRKYSNKKRTVGEAIAESDTPAGRGTGGVVESQQGLLFNGTFLEFVEAVREFLRTFDREERALRVQCLMDGMQDLLEEEEEEEATLAAA